MAGLGRNMLLVIGLLGLLLLALLFVLVLLLGTHYLIHRSVLSAFHVTDPRARRKLLLLFVALAVSIPLAMGLHRFDGNAITRSFHTLSSFWLGLALLPINNIASILVLSTKLSLLAWKKLTGSSLIR